MTHSRLHALTDGIFAIAMTLMVFEFKLPVLKSLTNHDLRIALLSQKEVFISYFISFTTLFVYWRAHNFVLTFLAKNIDINLLTFNTIFLLFVGLIPFTTQIAGTYHTIPLAVCIYALNIIAIGLSLFAMRVYIERSERIDNVARTPEQRRAALIRMLLPVGFALIAIPFTLINTGAAYSILLLGVGYNFLNNAEFLARRPKMAPQYL
jgi:uncharacterized membrane protein